jgi:hypothetical protein
LSQANTTINFQVGEIRNLRDELVTFTEKCAIQDSLVADQALEIENLSETNKQLKKYVEQIISSNASLPSAPKAGFSGIDRSYQRKILKSIKSTAECAMWFLKEFGLDVECIRVRDRKGERHCMTYQTSDEISFEEKEKLQKVLQLPDRFYISDPYYHELTVISADLPRTYLIKQLRSEMNTLCHIQCTPGKEMLKMN